MLALLEAVAQNGSRGRWYIAPDDANRVLMIQGLPFYCIVHGTVHKAGI